MDLLAELKHLMLLPALLAWLAVMGAYRKAGAALPAWVRWLGLQVAVACLTEVVGRITSGLHLPNVLLYNGYMLAEYALLSAVVGAVGGNGPRVRRTLWIAAALFAAVFVLEAWEHGIEERFLTNALLIGGFLLAVQAGWALYRLVDTGLEPLHRRPEFWALLSISLYFLGIVPVFGLYNYLAAHNPELARAVYAINDVLFILRYGLVALSFVLAQRTFTARP